MSAGAEHRTVGAIMFTDMVDYSALRRWVLLLSHDPLPGRSAPEMIGN
jgi:hypothetical protein